MIWTFDEFELDDQQYVLRHAGVVVPLRRKVFAVLHHLIVHHGNLVTKDELLAAVWPDETTIEAVVPQNVAILRNALGDSRVASKLIQTVHGRGYRFVAIVQTRESGQPPPPLAAAEAPCVGRERILTELRRLLEAASAGQGHTVLLLGEAGIGKTRLALELARAARARGVLVFEGQCQDALGAPAYRPWLQLLRPLRALVAESEHYRDVDRLLDATERPWPETPRDLQTAAEARFRVFEAVTALLGEVSRAQPLLLVFEDLHWVDQTSLQLLRFVARELRPLPLLVLGTTRPLAHVPTEPAEPLLATLAAETHVLRIALGGLSQAATSELLAWHAHGELNADTQRDVFALTEGNPFYVHELLRLLHDDSDSSPDASRLPERLGDVIELRVRRLGVQVEHVLTAAAVIGRSFDVAVLECIVELPRQALLAVISTGLQARILEELATDPSGAGAGRYAFSHALIQERLYGNVLHAERAQLHRRVGYALEALLGTAVETQLSELARHFCMAAVSGEHERAVEYCRRAAEQACAQLAFEQAVTHYRAGLSALTLHLPVDELERHRLKCGLAAALFRAGEDGTATYLEAAASARALARADLLAQVVFGLEGWPRLRRRGRTDNVAFYPLVREVLDLAETSPVLSLGIRARLASALALNMPETTPLAQQVQLSRDALTQARQVANPEVLYHALAARLRLMGGPDEFAARLELTRELNVVAEQLQQPERMFHARELSIQPLIALGRLAEADRELKLCAELAQRLQLPRFSLQILRFRLQRALADGRLDEVRTLTKEAVAVRGPAHASPNYLVGLYAWQSCERAWRGDRGWAARHLAALMPKVDQSRLLRAHVASLCASGERLDSARQCYTPLMAAEVLANDTDEDWLLTLIWSADAVVACEDRDAAALLYERLLPYAALNVTHVEWLMYFGSCAHWLGLLAALSGDVTVAAAHLSAAVDFNTQLGARPLAASSKAAYARLLLRRDPQDELGARLLAEARTTAKELGLEPLQRYLDRIAAHGSTPLAG